MLLSSLMLLILIILLILSKSGKRYLRFFRPPVSKRCHLALAEIIERRMHS